MHVQLCVYTHSQLHSIVGSAGVHNTLACHFWPSADMETGDVHCAVLVTLYLSPLRCLTCKPRCATPITTASQLSGTAQWGRFVWGSFPGRTCLHCCSAW